MGKKRKLMWYPRKLLPDLQLSGGQSVPEFEDWKIISTPGHTSMDISIYNAEHKLIYVADLVVKAKQKLSPPYPVHFPEIYRKSVAKLGDFLDYTVLMAHVKPQLITQPELNGIIEQAPVSGQSSKQAIINVLRKRLGLGFEAPKP
jgi:glyoxylase-like metal-dependent hydrolase (beta-lactamase superfamily II)